MTREDAIAFALSREPTDHIGMNRLCLELLADDNDGVEPGRRNVSFLGSQLKQGVTSL